MASAPLPADQTQFSDVSSPDEALESFGDTLASRGPVSAETELPAARRNTVLPSIEWTGDLPRLVHPQRQRYEELGVLGAGGMGEVVLAKDHDIDRTVAMKRLPVGVDMGAVVRFANEIRTVGSLEHPNIPPVHDVGVDANGRLFFLMKRIQGETLESVISRLRQKDPQTLAHYTYPMRSQIFLGVLAAIAYAHKQGFIHRDLKPANIMLGKFGEVTVVDWGLAKKIRGGERQLPDDSAPPAPAAVFKTQLGSVMGTPLYMSPEQARGEHDKVDERSDIYSLCVLFHELLVGEHYLAGKTTIEEVLTGVKTFTPEILTAKNLPAELGWFLTRGLKKNPAERFASVDEMIVRMQQILDGTFKVQCPMTMTKRLALDFTKVLDHHPWPVVIGTFAGVGLSLFSIGRLVLSLF